jgi:hypothetical protein
MRQYSNINASRALTVDEMARIAPSIFAADKHESRSERYSYIPTRDVLAGLMKEGFHPVAVKQSRSRDLSRREFTKHMIRFRREGENFKAVGDTLPEIVLVNSHDGTSSYHLDAGLFRLVCLNGMVVDDGLFASVRVPHKGDVVSKVIEGAYTVINESVKALEAPRNWSQIQLAGDERVALAEAAHVLRFADSDGNVDTPIQSTQLLVPRRHGDQGRDLWTTFNVVQENVIRGGLRGIRRDQFNRPRRVSTREVQGIDQDVRLNKALFVLADRMAKLKAAA